MTPTIRHVAFCAYVSTVALVNYIPLQGIVALGRMDPTASHLAIVPLVVVGLVFLDRRRIFSLLRSEPWAGGLIAVMAMWHAWITLSGTVATVSGHGLSASATIVVTLWVSGFVLLYGRTAARRAIFPLAFLAFMIPVPALVLDSAVLFLKHGSTEAVSILFGLSGTPYYREGFVFFLPNLAIEVADECSGIRSSIGLLLTSLLAGHWYLKRPWKKLALVAAVLPLAILKNSVRIASLSLLSIYVDPAFLQGQLHHEGGVLFFLLALFLMAPLVVFLSRSETMHQPKSTYQ